MKRYSPGPKTVLLLFILLLCALRLFLIRTFPMSPDEAYYFAWSRRPAVCYYDQPGMVAWVDYLFALPWRHPNAFTVRIAAVILSGLSAWFLFLAYREYQEDERAAAWFAGLFSLLPFAWLAGIIMIHDTTLLPWMALFFWSMVRLAKRDGRPGDWFLTAFFLAGAMYAKFSAVMLGWGILLYMLWSRKGRKWWRSWPPYAAGLFAAVLFSPVLFWNLEHDWVNLKAIRELTPPLSASLAGRLLNMGEFILSQIGIFSPLLGLFVFYALVVGALRALRRPEDDDTVLMASFSLPVFLYFLQQSARSHVFGNWPGVAYIPVSMLAMKEAMGLLSSKNARQGLARWFLAAGVALNFILVILFSLHLATRAGRPLFERIEERFGLDKPLDWRYDQEFSGWEEMVKLVMKYREQADFIMARRYQVASMLEFMLPDRPFVECYNQGRRGNQWDLWSTLPERIGLTALYVDDHKMTKEVRSRFREVIPLEAPYVVGNPRRPAKRWFIYLGRGWKGPRQEE